MSRDVPLRAVLDVFQDGDRTGWNDEFNRLWREQPDYMAELTEKIRKNGITLPILLGTDGRVWDGHHRLAVAQRLRYATVPVEFAGEHEPPNTGDSDE